MEYLLNFVSTGLSIVYVRLPLNVYLPDEDAEKTDTDTFFDVPLIFISAVADAAENVSGVNLNCVKIVTNIKNVKVFSKYLDLPTALFCVNIIY